MKKPRGFASMDPELRGSRRQLSGWAVAEGLISAEEVHLLKATSLAAQGGRAKKANEKQDPQLLELHQKIRAIEKRIEEENPEIQFASPEFVKKLLEALG